MAQCKDLPIYRDCGKLLNQLLPLTQSFPRFYKHTLGGRMVDLCLDMLSLLYRINSSRNKPDSL